MNIKVNVYTHKPKLYIKTEETEYYQNNFGGYGFGLYGNPEEWESFYCKTQEEIPDRLEKLKTIKIKQYNKKIKELKAKINKWESLSVNDLIS